MRTKLVFVALLAFMVSPALSFGAGTVSGKITYTGTPAKQKPIDMSKEPSCAKQHTTPVTTETVVTGANNTLANVVVYNWSRAASVPVDVGVLLSVGDRFEVRNVQDFFGAPILSGSYTGGPISIPMSGVSPPAIVGGALHPPPRTGPDFDVFVVLKTVS